MLVSTSVLPGETSSAGAVLDQALPQQEDSGLAVCDGVITAKVKAHLHADLLTQGYDIQVDTFHGIVQLSGFVETDEVKLEALTVTRSVEGVEQVDDLLDVRICSLPTQI
jgi:hyperosmotically inducible protein